MVSRPERLGLTDIEATIYSAPDIGRMHPSGRNLWPSGRGVAIDFQIDYVVNALNEINGYRQIAYMFL